MEINGPLDFLQPSGQVLAPQGDLILAPGNSVVVSGVPLHPRFTDSQDFGSAVTRWRNLYARGADFTEVPTVNGSGLGLAGEDFPIGYASYVVNESIDFITYGGTFTPIRWNEIEFEDSDFFDTQNNDEEIHFLRTGVYKITYCAILQKISSAGGASELEVEINDVGTTIRGGRGYVFHDGAGNDNDIGVCTKSFIREFTAGDFIEVQTAIINGGGNGAILDGTSIVLELIRLT